MHWGGLRQVYKAPPAPLPRNKGRGSVHLKNIVTSTVIYEDKNKYIDVITMEMF